jgi:radical SAM superfamily enzyme YgiQ (UPF0313 family)
VNKKIALVQVNSSNDGELIWSKSIGLEYISLYVESMCKISIPIFYNSQEILENAIMYDVIGFSVNSENANNSISTIKSIKDINKDIIIVVGGSLADSKSSDLLSLKLIDIVIIGEGEKCFVDLIKNNFRLNKKINGICYCDNRGTIITVSNKNDLDLDSLPLMKWNNCSVEDDIVNLSTSRGCPYSCYFCSCNMGKIWKSQSAKLTIKQIKYLNAQKSIKLIRFVDANFFVNANRAFEILKGIYQEYPNIKIAFDIRADQVINNKDMFTIMKNMNLDYLEIGIESGVDSILSTLGKNTTKKINDECIDFLADLGINILPTYIMWTPWITEAELFENYLYLCNKKFYICQRIFTTLQIYPGTAVQCRLEKENNLIDIGWKYNFNFVYPRVAQKYEIVNRLKNQLYQQFSDVEMEYTNTIFDCYIDDFTKKILKVKKIELCRSFYFLFFPIFDLKFNTANLEEVVNSIIQQGDSIINKAKKILKEIRADV